MLNSCKRAGNKTPLGVVSAYAVSDVEMSVVLTFSDGDEFSANFIENCTEFDVS